MLKNRNPRLFWLHFEGAGTDGNALPAQVLAKSLQQVQRIMNFGRRRMQIKPSCDCSLNVDYDERFEPRLCGLRNKLIRVRGRICYDEKGQPVRLTDMDEVQNGSVLEYGEITLRNITYKADPPLSFDVKFDHEHQPYELSGDFNILISGKSFSELQESLDAELDMLWVEYAQEEPQALSLDARELREQLVDRFQDMR